ncbi:polyamine-transporting ATPase 13A3-like [Hydra vulgaris]|uniref:Cation-transporting ATPase n=1 Tax=Hydra vulgaris TaxID=6087 RepID=A0ABM4BC69_HYDVU
MKPPRKKSYVSLDLDCCAINKNDESGESLCYGYTKNTVSYWKPNWKLYMTHSRCKLSLASKVLLLDSFNVSFVEPVREYQHNQKVLFSSQSIIGITGNYKYFYHKHLKYVLDEKNEKLIPVGGIENQESFMNLHEMSKGLSEDIRKQALLWHGLNLIDIKIKSLPHLFAEECTNPFYIFQVFSCIIWFLDSYFYFAGVIIFITLTSIMISIYETQKQLITLNKMVTTSTTVSILQSDGNITEISSQNLVPGDVIVLPKFRSTLYCDAALVSGTVIVNESMLTGESVPVTKISISRPNNFNAPNNEIFNTTKHSRNTLFCGTEVLQTRYYGDEKVLAVVIRTGFTTMKGELIRSILFPKPVDFKFFTDALKFIGVLFVFALIGCGYAFYAFYKNGFGTFQLVLESLDIFTIAVPPALPAAMSVGTVYALQRLKKQGIFCISPLRINISGRLDLFCFDKTGTLTEDGLDFCGVLKLNDETFSEIENDVGTNNDNVTIAMATCHSLTTINNELCGDSLDIKMFQATNWILEEPGAETERYENIVPLIAKSQNQSALLSEALEKQDFPLEVAILKQYTFSSELQRMSVVTRLLGSNHMNVYVKGSPEMVASLCKQETLPKTFDECLTSIAKKGYRIIALAYKELPKKLHWHKVQHFERSQIECELIFLGFIVMKNLLKKETAPVIEKLYNAHIRPVMITGDNILTAESVAHECGIVPSSHKVISITSSNDDSRKLIFSAGGLSEELKQESENLFLHRQFHFAVTGKAFSVIKEYHPSLYSRLLICGTIFARMLPDQKTSLVEDFQNIGYIVGMCGDGANDCGALKRAHTGISLSEAEASVASPFTSKVQNISCVLQVIKEGRCALVTSFNLFKFMALYSMIQYSSVLLLYSISSNLGDFQFLYIDLFIITSFAVTMGRTGPTDFLSPKPPLDRLMHPNVLFSIVMQIITQTGFQVLFFFYVKALPNYSFDHQTHGVLVIENFENTILFTATSFQYVLIALVFSPGFPYRKPFYHNKGLVACIVAFVAMNSFLLIRPCKFFMKVLEVKQVQDVAYFEVVFGLLLCNLLVSYIIDFLIVDSYCMRIFLNCLNRKRGEKIYQRLVPQFSAEPTLNELDESCNSVLT